MSAKKTIVPGDLPTLPGDDREGGKEGGGGEEAREGRAGGSKYKSE